MNESISVSTARLVQPVAPPAAFHHASREFVNDEYLAPLDKVVSLAGEELLRLDRIGHVRGPWLPGVVEVAHLRRGRERRIGRDRTRASEIEARSAVESVPVPRAVARRIVDVTW